MPGPSPPHVQHRRGAPSVRPVSNTANISRALPAQAQLEPGQNTTRRARNQSLILVEANIARPGRTRSPCLVTHTTAAFPINTTSAPNPLDFSAPLIPTNKRPIPDEPNNVAINLSAPLEAFRRTLLLGSDGAFFTLLPSQAVFYFSPPLIYRTTAALPKRRSSPPTSVCESDETLNFPSSSFHSAIMRAGW